MEHAKITKPEIAKRKPYKYNIRMCNSIFKLQMCFAEIILENNDIDITYNPICVLCRACMSKRCRHFLIKYLISKNIHVYIFLQHRVPMKHYIFVIYLVLI